MTTAICFWWADRKKSSSTPTARTFIPTKSKRSIEFALYQRVERVGLPDGIGEKVACMVVPDDDYDIALSRADLRRKS